MCELADDFLILLRIKSHVRTKRWSCVSVQVQVSVNHISYGYDHYVEVPKCLGCDCHHFAGCTFVEKQERKR